MPNKAILSVREIGQYLDRSPSTIYRMVERQEIPYILLGARQLGFPKDAIDEWVAEGLHKPRSHTGDIRRLQRAILNTPLDGDIRRLGGVSEMPKGNIKSRLNLGYGAIYQRNTKQGITRWYLDYKDAKGKRIQKVAGEAITIRDAIQALKQEVLRAFNEKFEPKIKKISFSDFSKVYLQNYVQVKRRNWMSEKYRLDALNAHFKDNLDLRGITPMAIQGFIKARQTIGNAGSTVNRSLALMKHLLNKAIEEGFLENNPVQKVKFFSEKENRIERVLTREEEARLMGHSTGYLKSVLIIALNTGMRLGEILNLKWNQIDVEAGKITVEKTKSGRPRIVFINSPLLAELQSMRSLNGKVPQLFLNEQTGKPLTLVRRSFLTACKKAGISNLRIHDLRHTFASRLLEKGADIETVRSLLGHYSIVMTQRYVHSRDEAKKKAVELLNDQTGKGTVNGENLLHRCDMANLPSPDARRPLLQNDWRSWN
jgi:excisionase family DNA binding protein